MDKQYLSPGSQSLNSATLDKQTVIGALQEALKHVQGAAYEIHMTADRLCGGQPEGVTGNKEPGPPISLFSQIEDVTRQLHDLASALASDNQRVQSRL